MVQTFQVLRCYKCSVFQVHPTKKSNKFQCKLCGEKQSIKRNYGFGTAKDCRLHVQKLNGIRGDLEELKSSSSGDEQEEEPKPKIKFIKPEKSKWEEYVEPMIDKKEPDRPMYLDNKEVVLEVPSKRTKTLRNKRSIYAKTGYKGKRRNGSDDDNYEEESSFNTFKEPECSAQTSKPIKFQPPLLADSKKNNKDEGKILAESKPLKAFKPPAVSGNSKWAHFVDEDENDSQHNIENKEYSPQPIHQSDDGRLFSLCDDADLDNVLHF